MLAQGVTLQNRYIIEKELGRGGFGAVYQAQDTRLRKTVAIKETHHANNLALVRKFEQEAFLMARLSHPALPNVSDYFEENQSYYLVMQFIPGETLGDYLARQPNQRVDEATARCIIMPLLDALEYLHIQNPPIIHRDIKPDNIRMTPNNKVYLVDFGIAREYDPNRPTTVMALTPGFYPYEQYASDMRTDARSDIYALGATLYYMLSGGIVPQEATGRLVNDPLLPLSHYNPSISPSLQSVVLKMLAVKPNNRCQSISELREAIREIEEQEDQKRKREEFREAKISRSWLLFGGGIGWAIGGFILVFSEGGYLWDIVTIGRNLFDYRVGELFDLGIVAFIHFFISSVIGIVTTGGIRREKTAHVITVSVFLFINIIVLGSILILIFGSYQELLYLQELSYLSFGILIGIGIGIGIDGFTDWSIERLGHHLLSRFSRKKVL